MRKRFTPNTLAGFTATPALAPPAGDWPSVLARQRSHGMLARPLFARVAGPADGTSPAADGPCVRDDRLARLEAVLLLAREPLSSRKLAQFTSLADGTEARTLIRVLSRFYQQQGAAFRIEEVAGGYQLFARPEFGPWLRRLYQSPVETRLSGPALETLAVVAYRQPVLRADVEAIRGVQSGEILRQLMERDLVKIVGRSAELGRPFLYGTSRRFLRIFGLKHLDDLPRVASLRPDASQALPLNLETTPGSSGDLDTPTICQRSEESDVRITALLEPRPTELSDPSTEQWSADLLPLPLAAKDEDEDDIEDEEDEELEDDEDEELEEDDLEEEEWEEVDDEEEELDEEDEDWEDDDEDDDWDDDEDDWDEDDEE